MGYPLRSGSTVGLAVRFGYGGCPRVRRSGGPRGRRHQDGQSCLGRRKPRSTMPKRPRRGQKRKPQDGQPAQHSPYLFRRIPRAQRRQLRPHVRSVRPGEFARRNRREPHRRLLPGRRQARLRQLQRVQLDHRSRDLRAWRNGRQRRRSRGKIRARPLPRLGDPGRIQESGRLHQEAGSAQAAVERAVEELRGLRPRRRRVHELEGSVLHLAGAEGFRRTGCAKTTACITTSSRSRTLPTGLRTTVHSASRTAPLPPHKPKAQEARAEPAAAAKPAPVKPKKQAVASHARRPRPWPPPARRTDFGFA